MNRKELLEAKRICEATTPPPWVYKHDQFPKLERPAPPGRAPFPVASFRITSDAIFTVHARTFTPRLIDEALARLEAEEADENYKSRYLALMEGLDEMGGPILRVMEQGAVTSDELSALQFLRALLHKETP